MSMGVRIKQIRDNENLTLQMFGDRIGKMSPSGISKMEKGDRVVTERTFEQICEKFNINEHWLRTGEGEMYKDQKDTLEYMALLGKIAKVKDKNIKRLLEKAVKLKEEDLEKFVKIVDVFIKEDTEDSKKEDS